MFQKYRKQIYILFNQEGRISSEEKKFLRPGIITIGDARKKDVIEGRTSFRRKASPKNSIVIPIFVHLKITRNNPEKNSTEPFHLLVTIRNKKVFFSPTRRTIPEIKKTFPSVNKPLSKKNKIPKKENKVPNRHKPNPIF